MKVLILGAGGWGALVGAYLANVGADVVLLFRRQAHVDAITNNGNKLIIEKQDGNLMVPVTATTDPNEIADADLMIVAVKNHDTVNALNSVRHIHVKAVASVQNGLGHEDKLRIAFPNAEVLRIVSAVAGSLIDFGRVRRGDDNYPTWVGNPTHGVTPMVTAVADLFNNAGLSCEAVCNIEHVEWCKLLWWTPSSITAVLARLPQTQVMQSPHFAHILVMITRDMLKTAQAIGVSVRDYPTIDVMYRCEGPVEESVRNVIRKGKSWELQGGAGYKQAMLLDIERERKTEIEDTGEYIWKLALEHGLNVPYLELGCRVVLGLESGFK